MKDLFPEYYHPSPEEFNVLWQKCIFIFDTNVLLNFYEYNSVTRQEFFKVLESLKERLWIPHQVALEYHQNRISRIKQAESSLETAKKDLEDTKKIFTNTVDNWKKIFPLETTQKKKNKDNIENAFNTFIKELEVLKKELSEKVHQTDEIRDKITDLFQGKIGESPTQEELNKIYSEGEQRYKSFIPPGFGDKDDKKGKTYIWKGLVFKREYGDLILWKQILKKVESKEFSHIIFITGDDKEDWWLKEDGQQKQQKQNKSKSIGPHPALVGEILEAGAYMFHMYTPERFLDFASKYKKVEVKEESIQQVEEVSTSNYRDIIDQVKRNNSLAFRSNYMDTIDQLKIAGRLAMEAERNRWGSVASLKAAMEADRNRIGKMLLSQLDIDNDSDK